MLLAYTEEGQATETGPFQFRSWVTPLGHAGTWTARPLILDSTSSWTARVSQLGEGQGGKALVGQIGPLLIGAFERTLYHVVMRTLDHGVTWATVVLPTEFPEEDIPSFTVEWDVTEFLDMEDGSILALGSFTDDGANTIFGLLRSTDGGATFTKFKPASMPEGQRQTHTGLVIGAGVALVTVKPQVGFDDLLYKTTDGGLSWAAISMPLPTGNSAVVWQMVRQPAGRIVQVGDRNSAGARKPFGRYSDDAGATWTVVNSLIPETMPNVRSFQPRSTVVLADGRIVTACNMHSAEATLKPFYVSTDNGLSFSQTGITYETEPAWQNFAAVLQMCVADDGAILAAATSQGSDIIGTEFLPIQFWRGVPSAGGIHWSKVFEAAIFENNVACIKVFIGNIGPLLAANLLGVPLDCVPVITPQPCPPACPPDPEPAAGQVVPPGSVGPTGTLAALFILGLAVGDTSGPRGALAVPMACGLPFVTSSCEPAGCPN